MQTFHGTNEKIEVINNRGVFGGLFGSVDQQAAASHGDMLYEITSPKPLSDYELNYEVAGAWEVAVSLCDGDEDKAEIIMTPGCEADFEEGFEMQRLRGKLAAKLGYTSIEMLDEHGTTWLCLPGCSISAI